jgi:hypothetical protein
VLRNKNERKKRNNFLEKKEVFLSKDADKLFKKKN